MLKTAANASGVPMEVFDQLRANVVADRCQFWKDLSLPFYGYNRPGAKASEGVRETVWIQPRAPTPWIAADSDSKRPERYRNTPS